MYSIIIPHYNIPDLLRRSLASVPRREDVQIIVIDDCSNEQALAELREIEKDFPYVQFLYSEQNKTAGHARNVGLEYANGDYIMFADADDFFHECFPQPWCRFVRRKLIEDGQIKFDEIFAINDTTFAYLAGYKADRIKVDRRKLYCITKRDDSLTFIPSLKRSLLVIDVLSKKNHFLKRHGIPVFDFEILVPFREYLKQRDWHSLGILFAKAKLCGYSKCFILFQMLGMSLRCRWSTFTGKKQEILTQLVWPRLFSVSR